MFGVGLPSAPSGNLKDKNMPKSEGGFMERLRRNKNAVLLTVGLLKGTGVAAGNEQVRDLAGVAGSHEKNRPVDPQKDDEQRSTEVLQLYALRRQDEAEAEIKGIKENIGKMPDSVEV